MGKSRPNKIGKHLGCGTKTLKAVVDVWSFENSSITPNAVDDRRIKKSEVNIFIKNFNSNLSKFYIHQLIKTPPLLNFPTSFKSKLPTVI